jgi:hypothetical protein
MTSPRGAGMPQLVPAKRVDLSADGGRNWNEGQIEMSFRRSE